MTTVAIEAVIRRSAQGATQPFICRSETGELYVVKGAPGCGCEALRAEWIAGRLAQSLGLPIPVFHTVEIPDILVRYSAVPGISELGAGQAFGSRYQLGAQEITWLLSQRIDPLLRARILLFDWLILNNDRILSPLGGNPNLICSGDVETFALIDHHGAFDREFDATQLWSTHIFRDARALWTPTFIAVQTAVLTRVASRLDEFWSELPESWHQEEDSTSSASALEHERLRTILMRPQTDPETFWNVTQ